MKGKKGKEIFFWITDKRYGFLDNFYPCKFVIAGKEYISVEHYYQSQKANSEKLREWIREANSAVEAKKRGRRLLEKEIVKGWQDKKILVMTKATYAKFSQDPKLIKKLLDTEDAILHEDSPDDLFWGVKGKDIMGKVLMRVRSRLRE